METPAAKKKQKPWYETADRPAPPIVAKKRNSYDEVEDELHSYTTARDTQWLRPAAVSGNNRKRKEPTMEEELTRSFDDENAESFIPPPLSQQDEEFHRSVAQNSSGSSNSNAKRAKFAGREATPVDYGPYQVPALNVIPDARYAVPQLRTGHTVSAPNPARLIYPNRPFQKDWLTNPPAAGTPEEHDMREYLREAKRVEMPPNEPYGSNWRDELFTLDDLLAQDPLQQVIYDLQMELNLRDSELLRNLSVEQNMQRTVDLQLQSQKQRMEAIEAGVAKLRKERDARENDTQIYRLSHARLTNSLLPDYLGWDTAQTTLRLGKFANDLNVIIAPRNAQLHLQHYGALQAERSVSFEEFNPVNRDAAAAAGKVMFDDLTRALTAINATALINTMTEIGNAWTRKEILRLAQVRAGGLLPAEQAQITENANAVTAVNTFVADLMEIWTTLVANPKYNTPDPATIADPAQRQAAEKLNTERPIPSPRPIIGLINSDVPNVAANPMLIDPIVGLRVPPVAGQAKTPITAQDWMKLVELYTTYESYAILDEDYFNLEAVSTDKILQSRQQLADSIATLGDGTVPAELADLVTAYSPGSTVFKLADAARLALEALRRPEYASFYTRLTEGNGRDPMAQLLTVYDTYVACRTALALNLHLYVDFRFVLVSILIAYNFARLLLISLSKAMVFRVFQDIIRTRAAYDQFVRENDSIVAWEGHLRDQSVRMRLLAEVKASLTPIYSGIIRLNPMIVSALNKAEYEVQRRTVVCKDWKYFNKDVVLTDPRWIKCKFRQWFLRWTAHLILETGLINGARYQTQVDSQMVQKRLQQLWYQFPEFIPQHQHDADDRPPFHRTIESRDFT